MHNACLEVWKSNAEPVTNSTISQTLKNLPNGTYVFGAYMAATDQSKEETRELIEGVSIFANETAVPVATNGVQNMDTIWAHSAKFNVAATVTDGTLKVGVNVLETSASFVVMDNATLYYFGEMEPDAALDAMAKIDMAEMVAIADTCVGNKMNAAVASALNEAIASAKEVTANADLYTGIENLGWAVRQSVQSIKAYRKVAQAIKTANEVAAQEWSEYVAEAVAALNALIEEVSAKYEEGTVEYEEIDSLSNSLAEAAAYVKLDDVYNNLDLYDAKIGELSVGEEGGEYTEEAVDEMISILEEVGIVLADVEEGTISAADAITMSNNLFAKIDDLLASPNEEEEFPITIARSTELLNNKKILKGAYLDENGLARFKSKTYAFDYPLQKLRFVIKQNGNNSNNNGYPFVALSDFAMYDEYGDPIELTTDMVTSNAEYNALNPGKQDGMGIAGLLDGDLTTYFHSAYANGPAEYHYIEVTLPEDTYYGFSFSMAARSNSEFHTGQFPAEMEIQHLSEAAADLQAAVAAAKHLKPYQGTDPGFYNADVTPFMEAFAAAQALIDTEASEAEMFAAISKLVEEQAILEEAFIMPDPEKKYRIVSAYAEFFNYQNKQKAMTVGSDSCLWWENAHVDSVKQEFFIEADANGFNIRSAANDTYVNRAGGYYKMLDNATDSLMLVSLGKGEFGLKFPQESTVLHPCDHNSGKVGAGWNGSVYGTGGGLFGESSRISSWGSASAGTVTSWYIREMTALPNATKSISELNFRTKTLHVYEGVNTLILTADKECAFADLTIYGRLGQKINAEVSVEGKVATVRIDTTAMANLSFEFTNSEQVSEVTLDATLVTYSANYAGLQNAYDKAIAVDPVEGNDVGQVSDLSAYNAAIEAAEQYMEMGGSEEEIEAAIVALGAAVDSLTYNEPKADKEYFIISALDFKRNYFTDMAICQRNGDLFWGYANVNKPAYRWRFVDCGQEINGSPAYYVENVASGKYISQYVSNAGVLYLVDTPESTQPYNIYNLTGGKVCVNDARSESGAYSLHPLNHGNGGNAYGSVIS